jgi:hypothetical protein
LMDRVGRMPVIMSGMALMASTAAAAAISTVQYAYGGVPSGAYSVWCRAWYG